MSTPIDRAYPRSANPGGLRRPRRAGRMTRWVLVLAALVVAGAWVVRSLPADTRLSVRRVVLRVAGEVAHAALAIHDPWKHQEGAQPGGLPGPDFLALTPRDRGSFPDGRGGTVLVSGTGDEPVPVAPPFEFERWDDPGIAELRGAAPIGSLAVERRPDYPSLLAASEWVARTLHPGPQMVAYATHFDAREILERTRRGEGFDCGTFAWTLIQVLGSLGINARLVELETDEGLGHSVTEAWCDDLERWIVLDPYTATTFELHGVPLSALDLHRLWKAGRSREVTARHAPGIEDRLAALQAQGVDPLSYYAHFNVRMRNNVRSTSYPRWHPKANRIMSAFEWAGDGGGRPFYRHQVRDSARLYFPLKTTALRWRDAGLDEAGRPRIEVWLATMSSNFDAFVVSRDRRLWTEVPAHLTVPVRAGRDTLWFAARNRAGRHGQDAWIATEWHPGPAPRAHAQTRPRLPPGPSIHRPDAPVSSTRTRPSETPGQGVGVGNGGRAPRGSTRRRSRYSRVAASAS